METNLKLKHAEELKSVEEINRIKNANVNGQSKDNDKKVSRAQRRRDKKEMLSLERRKELEAEDAENAHLMREIERQKILESDRIDYKLSQMNACLYQIPPDGDCLYNSIAHQLSHKGGRFLEARALRKVAARYLREHVEDFLPFMPDLRTPDAFNGYCNDVEHTNAWGGHYEIQAISQSLRVPIDVIQAVAPTQHIGQEFSGPTNPPLVISYHRHMYSLGEHYNSVCDLMG